MTETYFTDNFFATVYIFMRQSTQEGKIRTVDDLIQWQKKQ